MSRTRRRASPGYRSGSAKLYRHTFSHEDHVVLAAVLRDNPRLLRYDDAYLRQHHCDTFEEECIVWMARSLHEEIYRNGSCRRQRSKGVRKDKRFYRGKKRTAGKRNLKGQLDDHYCDILEKVVDAGILYFEDDDADVRADQD